MAAAVSRGCQEKRNGRVVRRLSGAGGSGAAGESGAGDGERDEAMLIRPVQLTLSLSPCRRRAAQYTRRRAYGQRCAVRTGDWPGGCFSAVGCDVLGLGG
jgi:hypothetical protein